jgi:F0F1-type ATP synthase membrane subunit a
LLLFGFAIVVAMLSTRIAMAAETEAPSASHSAQTESKAHQASGPEEKGVSPKPLEIAAFHGFPITNSMLVSWVVALGLIIFAQLATRKMQPVPVGKQNFVEWIVEGLYNFLAGIIGPHLTNVTFWFFASIFVFILSANWVGLIPGVGTIGWGHQTSHGFTIDQPLFPWFQFVRESASKHIWWQVCSSISAQWAFHLNPGGRHRLYWSGNVLDRSSCRGRLEAGLFRALVVLVGNGL